MNASKTALVAVLTIGSLGLAAGSVSACGGRGGYGGGYGGYSHHKVYVKKVYVHPVVVEPCYHPFHCFAIVNPGDSWFTLSLREYGRPHLWKKIAIFNGLPLNAGLLPGMQLKLPVIHPNGVLLPSSAPAPIAIAAGGPIGLPQAGGIPQANFIPQGAPQGGPIGPQANFAAPQGANFGAPQGANFAAPQGAATNPQSFGAQSFGGPTAGAPAMGAPNGAPGMFQGNGPVMPNMGQPGIGQPGMGQPSLGQPAAESPTVNVAPSMNVAPGMNAAPAANIRTVATEARTPSVAIGSILTLDGQSLGAERGAVRLKVNGLALPVEVLEWNATIIKIQLPQLDVAGVVKAELEVLRADGSLASKSAVELTPATNRLALGN